VDPSGRFGPNADDVVDLLEQLDRLGMAEVLSFSAARWGMTIEPGTGGSAWIDLDAGRATARAHLRELAEDHGRLDVLRAVGDEVAAWSTSLAHWFPAGVVGVSPAAEELPPRMAAAPPILDAAYATAMADLLTEEETDLLCAAWDAVVPDAGAEEDTFADGATLDGEAALADEATFDGEAALADEAAPGGR